MTVQDMNSIFGKNLSYYRKQMRNQKGKRVSMQALCRLIGVTKNQVGFWERGEKLPTYSNLVLLAQILNVEIWKLFYEGETNEGN